MRYHLISTTIFRRKKLLVIVIALWLAACHAAPQPSPTATMTLTGQPLKSSQPAVYRLMEDGRLRHIHDWPTYLALGYQPEDIVTVADEILAAYPLDLPLTRWLTGQTDPALYWLKDGRRYRVPDLATLETMGGSVLDDWLRTMLRRLKAEGMTDVFDRLFFVPHPYGLNHPPEYGEDINSVLGFRVYAQIFKEEIGFVPVMIAGEGGWRPGEAQDNRYPAIDDKLHRDYHLAVFDWFRTGQLSNGEPLSDYLFAFCPWLISDPHDPAAWFDSAAGDHTLTIEAVEAMPVFERKFSWDK